MFNYINCEIRNLIFEIDEKIINFGYFLATFRNLPILDIIFKIFWDIMKKKILSDSDRSQDNIEELEIPELNQGTHNPINLGAFNFSS